MEKDLEQKYKEYLYKAARYIQEQNRIIEIKDDIITLNRQKVELLRDILRKKTGIELK